MPELSKTTTVLRKLREGFFYRNNPKLQNSYEAFALAQHNYSNDYIDLTTRLYVLTEQHPFIVSFIQEEIDGRRAIVQQIGNGKRFLRTGGKVAINYKPLGNEQLRFHLYASPTYAQYVYAGGNRQQLFSLPIGGGASFRYKSLGVQADITLPQKALRSYFVGQTGWYSALAANYQWRQCDWRVSVENLFSPERSTSIDHSYRYYAGRNEYIMRDNYWKVAIGFSYHFSSGKGFNYTKELENEDSDQGRL